MDGPHPLGRVHRVLHQGHDIYTLLPVKIVDSVTMRYEKRTKFLECVRTQDPSYLAIQEWERVTQESKLPQELCIYGSRRRWNADVCKWRRALRGLHLALISKGLAPGEMPGGF